jgi:hypothetical protein
MIERVVELLMAVWLWLAYAKAHLLAFVETVTALPLWLGWALAPSLLVVGVALLVSAWRSRRPTHATTAASASLAHPASTARPPADLAHTIPRRWFRRGRTPLAPPEARAFDALASRWKLDRRGRRLVERLAAAIDAKPVALLLSPSAMSRAARLLDDPPRNSGLSPLTLDERRRLLTIAGEAAPEVSTRVPLVAGPGRDGRTIEPSRRPEQRRSTASGSTTP